MKYKIINITIGATLILLSTGCATIIPPPDRVHWDSADSNTVCTDNPSAVHGQSAARILARGVGGVEIGVGLAAGYFPVLGIGLAAIGIAGGNDSDVKYEQVKKCKEFKDYVLLRGTAKSKITSSEDKLRNLKDLNEKGLISDEEYLEKRRAILELM